MTDEIRARVVHPWKCLRFGSLERGDYVLSSRVTLVKEGTWERQGTVTVDWLRLQEKMQTSWIADGETRGCRDPPGRPEARVPTKD